MLIDSIQNGIVIDHITAGKAMELYQILGLDKLACTVAILKNVTSGKLGRKDIIKIDGEMELDWDLIGYVDPSITVNIIRGGELQEKRTLKLPERIRGVLHRCLTETGYLDDMRTEKLNPVLLPMEMENELRVNGLRAFLPAFNILD